MGRTIALLLVITKFSLAATYDVPAPKGLETEARWETKARATIVEDSLHVDYLLPEDLIGKHPVIRFRGQIVDGFAAVSGNEVKGHCMISKDKPLACVLRYPGLEINSTSAEDSLKAHFTGNQLDLRTRLSRIFRGDPAGLLMVELK